MKVTFCFGLLLLSCNALALTRGIIDSQNRQGGVIVQSTPTQTPDNDAKILYDGLAIAPRDLGNGKFQKLFKLDKGPFAISCMFDSMTATTSCTIVVKAGSHSVISRQEGKIAFEVTGDLAAVLYAYFVHSEENPAFTFETTDKMATLSAQQGKFSLIF